MFRIKFLQIHLATPGHFFSGKPFVTLNASLCVGWGNLQNDAVLFLGRKKDLLWCELWLKLAMWHFERCEEVAIQKELIQEPSFYDTRTSIWPEKLSVSRKTWQHITIFRTRLIKVVYNAKAVSSKLCNDIIKNCQAGCWVTVVSNGQNKKCLYLKDKFGVIDNVRHISMVDCVSIINLRKT